jgi:hypothetical protein
LFRARCPALLARFLRLFWRVGGVNGLFATSAQFAVQAKQQARSTSLRCAMLTMHAVVYRTLNHPSTYHLSRLSVRLLVPRTRTWTTKLLGLAPAVVGDEECAVVGDKGLLELVFAVLVDVLLVVGDLE